jgi:hypothetical protein
MDKTRAIPELSVDTLAVEKILCAIEIGDVVPYETLSGAIGRDVQHQARHILDSARQRCLRERQMVFAPVFGVGMKRLDDIGIISTGTSAVKRINNMARVGSRKLAAVANFDALPNDQKVKHNVTMSQLGVLAHMTKGSTAKKIEARIGDAPMPTAKFLASVIETL